jgi:DNA-binding NarL/FixJ family response regulator
MNNKRVLIAEDEYIISMYLKTVLEDINCDVVGVIDNADELFSKISKLKPDLIIMDIYLKGSMNGVELSEKIRENHYNIPIIYLTGNIDDFEFKKAEKTQPIVILSKPVDSVEIKDSINKLFNN